MSNISQRDAPCTLQFDIVVETLHGVKNTITPTLLSYSGTIIIITECEVTEGEDSEHVYWFVGTVVCHVLDD